MSSIYLKSFVTFYMYFVVTFDQFSASSLVYTGVRWHFPVALSLYYNPRFTTSLQHVNTMKTSDTEHQSSRSSVMKMNDGAYSRTHYSLWFRPTPQLSRVFVCVSASSNTHRRQGRRDTQISQHPLEGCEISMINNYNYLQMCQLLSRGGYL